MNMFKNKAKRIYLPGEFYFVTVKTFKNKKIFEDEIYARIFFKTLLFLKRREDFNLSASVLLYNHFHLLLLPKKKNISQIMHDLKSYTTKKISEQMHTRRGMEASSLGGGIKILKNFQRQGFHALPHGKNWMTVSIKIWQRSYYYHIIVNQRDFNNHFNYIYYNPVKHRYVDDSNDWPYLIIDKQYHV